MSKKQPLVSIITPSYNQGDFIEDTLLSVKNQNYSNVEHIVVDGGSTDNTLEILKEYQNKYNLSWLSEPDEGQSEAINKGFKIAQGEFVGWLNSDDVYFDREVISYIANEFLRFVSPDIIYGDLAVIDRNGTIKQIRRALDWEYDRLLRFYSLPQPSTFFRNKVVKNNFLKKELNYSMDLEYWLRLGKKYEFLHVERILSGIRAYKGVKRFSKQAEIESKKLRKKYGQDFDLDYKVLQMKDKIEIALKRIKGIKDILEAERRNFAFKAKIPSKVARIWSQIDLIDLQKFVEF